MAGRLETLRELVRPKLIGWGSLLIGAIAAYDSCSNQFPQLGLRKLGDILLPGVTMTGALLPWWGWLLILQAIFVYSLFEYVRRNIPLRSLAKQMPQYDKDASLDLSHLLYFAVLESTVVSIDGLIAEAPQGPVPLNSDKD